MEELEIWKDIPDYKGYYLISNFGRVMSIRRKCKILKGNIKEKGYMSVCLKKENTKKWYYIHRLVANNFINNKELKPFINHLDCNPSNNKVDNLEWCTPQENVNHMIKLGRNTRTEEWNERRNKSNSKYKKKVLGINIKTGEEIILDSMHDGEKYGFKAGDICRCCKDQRKTSHGYIWRYL